MIVRSHRRYAVHKLVSYYYGDRRFLTLTLDLGFDGMKVETSHSLSKNDPLDIQLVLGHKSIWPQ